MSCLFHRFPLAVVGVFGLCFGQIEIIEVTVEADISALVESQELVICMHTLVIQEGFGVNSRPDCIMHVGGVVFVSWMGAARVEEKRREAPFSLCKWSEACVGPCSGVIMG